MPARWIASAALIALGVWAQPILAADGFGTFKEESARATKALACPRPGVTPGDGSVMGDLYGCILGTAETAKWFVNEVPGTGRVENVKLMWNDWHRNIGYGLHADEREAKRMLRVLAKLYAPRLEADLAAAFAGDQPASFETERFRLEYSWYHGPGIDERLIIVTEK